jgi:hypothetical protein
MRLQGYFIFPFPVEHGYSFARLIHKNITAAIARAIHCCTSIGVCGAISPPQRINGPGELTGFVLKISLRKKRPHE